MTIQELKAGLIDAGLSKEEAEVILADESEDIVSLVVSIRAGSLSIPRPLQTKGVIKWA